MITTDPQDEMFTLVDENDIVLGKISRNEANSNPHVIHRAINVFIYNRNQELLIQKRSPTKDVDPEAWSISVGGHVDYGETYEETAIRETFEELGIVLDPHGLKELGKVLMKMPNECEYVQVYEYRMIEDVELNVNTEEIAEVKFVSTPTLYAMLEDASVKWSTFARETLKQFPMK